MIVKNLTEKQLYKALELVNKTPLLNGNLDFRRLEKKGKKKEIYQLTLKTKGYKNFGYRRGQGDYNSTFKLGAKLPYACWHAHGLFFLACYQINPNVEIISNHEKVDPLTWMDRNIGSKLMPLWYSEACDCSEELLEQSIDILLPETKHIILNRNYGKTEFKKNK